MTPWRWIDKAALLALHDESLAEHGGATGMRDEGLLDSAWARPLNLAAYGEPTQTDATLAMLAVAAGEVTEAQFADWIRQHTTPR